MSGPRENEEILKAAYERIELVCERAKADGLADFVIFVGDAGLGRRPVVELLARPDAIGIAAADTPEIVPALARRAPDLPVSVVVTSRRGGTTVFDCAPPGRAEALGLARPRTEALR